MSIQPLAVPSPTPHHEPFRAATPEEQAFVPSALASIGLAVKDFHPLNYKSVNSVGFRILLDGDELMLAKKLTGSRCKNDDFTAAYIRLLDTLVQNGAETIPLRPADPPGYFVHDGSKWMLFPYLDGRPYGGTGEEPALLGSSLAKLHRALRHNPDPFWIGNGTDSIGWCRDPMSTRDYGYLPGTKKVRNALQVSLQIPPGIDIEKSKTARRIVDEETVALLDAASFVERTLQGKWDTTIVGLGHGNVSSGNVLVVDGRAKIIDFEKIRWGSVLYDIGDALATTVEELRKVPATERMAAVEKLIDAYRQTNGVDIRFEDVVAYGVAHHLHLAVLNINNLFVRGFDKGYFSFEGHLRDVGRLMKLLDLSA